MTHNVFAAIQVNLQRSAGKTLLSIPGGRNLTGSDLDAESAILSSALVAEIETSSRTCKG